MRRLEARRSNQFFPAVLSALLFGGALALSPDATAQPGPTARPGSTAQPHSTAQPGPATPASSKPDAESLDQRLRALLGRPGGLTARQASARAIATSNELKQSGAEVRSAAADKDQAAVGYVPRVTLTARYTRLSEVDTESLGTLVATTQPGPVAPGQPLVGVNVSFPQILDQYLLQANVTVPLTDYFLRTNHANRSASHSLQAAKYRQQVSKRNAALQAQLAYYAWAQSTLAEVVAEQTLEQARAHYKVAEAARKAETLTRAELMRFDAQVASAELMLERARSRAEINADTLHSILHDPDSKTYRIGEDLLAPLPPIKREKASDLQRRAQRARPEFKALSETERALASQRSAVKASTLPRLDAFGNAYYANPHQRVFPQQDKWTASWDAGLQLTYVINDVPSASASARSLEAKQSGVRAQQASLRDMLRRELSQAQRSAIEADVALKVATRGLAASEEAYRATLLQFRAERAKSVDLMDANTELLRARLELITAHINQRVSRTKLAYALGKSLK